MNLDEEEEAEELHNWMGDTDPEKVEAVLEFLGDNGLLTHYGLKVKSAYWRKYLKEEK